MRVRVTARVTVTVTGHLCLVISSFKVSYIIYYVIYLYNISDPKTSPENLINTFCGAP